MTINSITEKYGIDLQIGFTDICSFRCIMCLQTSHSGLYGSKDIKTPFLHKDNQGFMSYNTLENIFIGLENFKKIRLIKLQWLGESLLHPNFIEFTKRIINEKISKNIMATSTFFNIDIVKINQLLKAVKNSSSEFYLLISLDSFKASTYKVIKGIDVLKTVLNNIDNLIFSRKKMGVENFHIILQMIVMEENHLEAKEFLLKSKEILENPLIIYDQEAVPMLSHDKVFFKRLGAVKQKKYERLHIDTLKSIGILPNKISSDKRIITTSTINSNKGRRPCPAPFLTPTINWDGSVTVCCMDAELELKIGNINESTLYELWSNNYIKSLRQAHINSNYEMFPRCARCENIDLLPINTRDYRL